MSFGKNHYEQSFIKYLVKLTVPWLYRAQDAWSSLLKKKINFSVFIVQKKLFWKCFICSNLKKVFSEQCFFSTHFLNDQRSWEFAGCLALVKIKIVLKYGLLKALYWSRYFWLLQISILTIDSYYRLFKRIQLLEMELFFLL